MVYEKKFIQDPLLQYQIMEFLEKQFNKSDIANIDVQRTPIVTRITLEAARPSAIIGRRSGLLNSMSELLKTKFAIENPQINVVQVKDIYLEPRLVGRKAAKMLEMGKKARTILSFLLQNIMNSGALGAEIVVSGAMNKGARARRTSLCAGFIPKAGEPANLVREAQVISVTRFGSLGILVRIVPPGTVFPDKIIPNQEETGLKSETKAEEVKKEAPLVEEKPKQTEKPTKTKEKETDKTNKTTKTKETETKVENKFKQEKKPAGSPETKEKSANSKSKPKVNKEKQKPKAKIEKVNEVKQG